VRVCTLRYSPTVDPSKLDINDSSEGSMEKSVGTANGFAAPVVIVMVAGLMAVAVDLPAMAVLAPVFAPPVLNANVQGKEVVGWVVTGTEIG
jgi:hypothetical protein